MDIFQEWLNLNTPADESQYKRDVELDTRTGEYTLTLEFDEVSDA